MAKQEWEYVYDMLMQKKAAYTGPGKVIDRVGEGTLDVDSALGANGAHIATHPAFIASLADPQFSKLGPNDGFDSIPGEIELWNRTRFGSPGWTKELDDARSSLAKTLKREKINNIEAPDPKTVPGPSYMDMVKEYLRKLGK